MSDSMHQNTAPPVFAGVDVGGTFIKLGVVDDDGQTLARTEIPTEQEKGPADGVDRIRAALTRLLTGLERGWEHVGGVGLGTPGPMDIAGGMILAPVNLPGWRDFPVRDCLGDACGKPIAFSNDANAAGYGEYWVGRGRSHDSLVMFTLGTGVGGAIILGGRSVDGDHSFGSELGHIVIDRSDDARLCVWGGGRGELEAYASASAVTARAQEGLDGGAASTVRRRLDAGETLTPKLLGEEAETGDAFALSVIVETGRDLGLGVLNVAHTIDPGIVVLGGAMNFGGDATGTGRRFLAAVRAEFRARAFAVVADTPIEYASLGGHAGYIGAAGLAREAYRSAGPG